MKFRAGNLNAGQPRNQIENRRRRIIIRFGANKIWISIIFHFGVRNSIGITKSQMKSAEDWKGAFFSQILNENNEQYSKIVLDHIRKYGYLDFLDA